MRCKPRDNEDSQVIKRFEDWARKTGSALYNGQSVPPSSKFVLTSFVFKLCSIHRNRTLPDEYHKAEGCENHNYLYIALRLCYDFNLKLRTKVSLLLREIFLCEESLEAIFSILQRSRPVSSTSCKWRMRDSNDNINTYTLYPRLQYFDRSAFEYFVKNICPLARDVRETESLQYTPESVLSKPIDDSLTTPLLAASALGDAALVLLLLRHGADPLLWQRGDDIDLVKKSPVRVTVDQLNIASLLKDSSWAGLRQDDAVGVVSKPLYPEDSEVAVPENMMENSFLCLSYFSRAVYALDIRETSKAVDTTTPPQEVFSQGVYFELHRNVTELVDVAASFRRPPSLRHACRYVIRRAVTRAGVDQIPAAIKTLPVPTMVQGFLDLRS